MNKTDIKKNLSEASGGAKFITLGQLKKALGVKNPNAAKRYLEGLSAVSDKYYLISEVADQMWRTVK